MNKNKSHNTQQGKKTLLKPLFENQFSSPVETYGQGLNFINDATGESEKKQ